MLLPDPPDPPLPPTDVEFGRIQARDLLQHLWTGPISNAPVEIIQVRREGRLGCCLRSCDPSG